LNKNNIVFYSALALTIVCGILEYYGIFKVSAMSEILFYPFYSMMGTFVIPFLLFVTLFYLSYKLIFKSFYLDEGLSVKTKEGKTENIEFLNRFGVIGTFINNDIRMMKRNKHTRSITYLSIFFLFYGFIFLNNMAFIGVFIGIFVTGGFLFSFGQKIPAWDSSCYPLMMTLNIPYRKYLEAKWWLMVIVTVICMVAGTLYIFVSREMFLGVIAGGVYNIGVNSLIVMIAGVYNKTPVDLNSRVKAFANSNSMNMRTLLLVLPQVIVPMVVCAIMNDLFGIYAAAAAIILIGLAGFLFRNKAFDFIVKLYKKEKYLTINAYGKTE
jgi:multisubunit Na+/H+ antiporter MnhC subunit